MRERPTIMQVIQKWINKGINAIFGLAALLVLYVLAQIFLFATFKIPSNSMEPTLMEGDIIYVHKPAIGARLFNIWNALKGEKTHIYRMPGFSKIKRNDVLVFNYPYQEWNKWDEMRLNMSEYYVKRCVATSGDTLSIHEGIFMVGAENLLVGNLESQKRIMKFNPENIPDEQYHTLPFDSAALWNIREFGPFYIPAKGDSISMNRMNYLLYKRMIAWEQDAEVRFQDGKVYLGTTELNGYRFKSNYYFMSGDNSMNSVDSRFWGVIPEEFIVGKANVIIASFSQTTGKIRWNRILKRIKFPLNAN